MYDLDFGHVAVVIALWLKLWLQRNRMDPGSDPGWELGSHPASDASMHECVPLSLSFISFWLSVFLFICRYLHFHAGTFVWFVLSL